MVCLLSRLRLKTQSKVDFFNVTNAQTTIGQVTTFGSSYLFPFSTINPFVTRFGLRFIF